MNDRAANVRCQLCSEIQSCISRVPGLNDIQKALLLSHLLTLTSDDTPDVARQANVSLVALANSQERMNGIQCVCVCVVCPVSMRKVDLTYSNCVCVCVCVCVSDAANDSTLICELLCPYLELLLSPTLAEVSGWTNETRALGLRRLRSLIAHTRQAIAAHTDSMLHTLIKAIAHEEREAAQNVLTRLSPSPSPSPPPPPFPHHRHHPYSH